MVAMLSYFVAIFAVIDDPSGTVATIATFLPPSAPFVVPLRAAFDAIPPWQIGVSAILTLIGIYVLFTIGARVYAGAVLQFGGRIKLRDAWRSGRVAERVSLRGSAAVRTGRACRRRARTRPDGRRARPTGRAR